MQASINEKSAIHIAICDDDADFARSLKNMLGGYLDSARIDKKITLFESGETLIEWPELNSLDMLLIDIKMKGMNGLETAKIVRERNPKILIVFVTEFLEYAPEGYEVSAFRYIVKSNLAPTFDGIMDAVIHKLGYNRNSIELEFTTGKHSVYTDEIAYAESAKHSIELYDLAGGTIGRVYMRLDELESLLPETHFVRTHQSFLANIEFISGLQPRNVILKNGLNIPVSQRKYTEVKNQFYRYIGAF